MYSKYMDKSQNFHSNSCISQHTCYDQENYSNHIRKNKSKKHRKKEVSPQNKITNYFKEIVKQEMKQPEQSIDRQLEIEKEEQGIIKQKIIQVNQNFNYFYKQISNLLAQTISENYKIKRNQQNMQYQFQNQFPQYKISLSEYERMKKQKQCYLNKIGWKTINDKYIPLQLLKSFVYWQIYEGYNISEFNHVIIKNYFYFKMKQHLYKEFCQFNQFILQKFKQNSHENIVKIIDWVQIQTQSFIIMEYCQNGDLLNWISNKKVDKNFWKEFKRIIKQILEGLHFLNQKNIIHYNLRPQNIHFSSGQTLKLAEYGMIYLNMFQQMGIKNSGYFYTAPQFFLKKQNKQLTNKVDMFSLGVIIYEILFNKNPYFQIKTEKKFQEVKQQFFKISFKQNFQVVFPSINLISSEIKDFLKKCLQLKPSQRISVQQALQLPIFK